MFVQSHPMALSFYVYNECRRDFRLVAEASVKCVECGRTADDMALVCIDTTRDAWMLECACGEQFFTHND